MLIIVGTINVAVTPKPFDRFDHDAGFEARQEHVLAAQRGDEKRRGAVGQMEHRRGVDVDAFGRQPESVRSRTSDWPRCCDG